MGIIREIGVGQFAYQGEKISISLSTMPSQEVVENNEVASWPPFLQTTQPKFAQPLLNRTYLPAFYQLCCPPTSYSMASKMNFDNWHVEIVKTTAL